MNKAHKLRRTKNKESFELNIKKINFRIKIFCNHENENN